VLAISRSRTPGSWAMHNSARAWLVRKPQVMNPDRTLVLETKLWKLFASY
jgi:hypothetical protein